MQELDTLRILYPLLSTVILYYDLTNLIERALASLHPGQLCGLGYENHNECMDRRHPLASTQGSTGSSVSWAMTTIMCAWIEHN